MAYWEKGRDEWAKRHGFVKEYDSAGNIQYVGESNGGKVIFRTTALPDSLEEELQRQRSVNELCTRLAYAHSKQ